MDAVRFAFIGCGTIAPFHLRALEECTHSTEVTAAVDVRRDRAEKFSSLLQSPCQVGGANYDVDLAGYPRSQAVGNEARRVGLGGCNPLCYSNMLKILPIMPA